MQSNWPIIDFSLFALLRQYFRMGPICKALILKLVHFYPFAAALLLFSTLIYSWPPKTTQGPRQLRFSYILTGRHQGVESSVQAWVCPPGPCHCMEGKRGELRGEVWPLTTAPPGGEKSQTGPTSLPTPLTHPSNTLLSCRVQKSCDWIVERADIYDNMPVCNIVHDRIVKLLKRAKPRI